MTASAWRLFCPSVSGGKVYDILLVDCYVLVGWGPMSGTKQYKVERFPLTSDARAWAVAQTEAKEKKGYQLDGTVHQSLENDQFYLDQVSRRFGHRGSSAALDLLFHDIYKVGIRLK